MAIAKWIKIDFHTHTPASRCFKNRSTVTPEQWLEAVKNSGLDAVVVTDHNSVEWISKLRNAIGERKDIFIYPGVELCVGTSYIHILVIFDPKMKTEDIEDFVVQCGIPKSVWGDTTKFVKEDTLASKIREYSDKVLVIPAHFTGTKGICKTLGQNGIQAFFNIIPFNAIEVRNEEDINEVENKVKNKVFPPLAVVTGSDNPGNQDGEHDIVNFGKAFTCIKISEFSLEALRQVFLDYRTRCYCVIDGNALEDDYNTIEHNYIAGMRIQKLRHVNDLDFRFSPYLNCIIGGRGTGKSTIIEMIRLSLRAYDESKKYPRLFETYEDNSQIDLYYNFGSNNSYCIHVNGKKNNRTYKIENNDGITEDYPSFPVQIYSQKQLFNIVEDDDNPEMNDESPLLKIVDENILSEKSIIEEKKERIKSDILMLVQDLLIKRNQIKDIPRIKAEIELEVGKLVKIKDTGIIEKREEIQKLQESYKNIATEFSSFKSSINEINNAYIEKNVKLIEKIKSEFENEVISAEDKSVTALLDELNNDLLNAFAKSKTQLEIIENTIANSKLKKDLDTAKVEYNELLSQNGNLDIEKLNEIENDIEVKRTELDRLKNIKSEVDEIIGNISAKITKFMEVHEELTEARRKILNDINSKATNISLSIHSLSHGERWLYNLRKELGKENSFEADFIKIKNRLFNNNILVRERFVDWLKYILLSEDGEIKNFLGEENFNDVRFKNIWTEKNKDKTLHTLINFIPEDRITINIINEGQALSINEGSPGQKTAAVLAFILNQGKHPLVIDQPEDDLDNSLILNLIVENIRRLKSSRQIIIATHNPNIPVLGDAEGIIMLDRDKDGKVIFKDNKKTGCIEEKTIKKGICDIMEGGIEAFKRREDKYKYVDKLI